ncbi:MAG: hypothetical protein JWR72_2604 [Flavisolibacter sp.]|jgi:hypothetical protein|nr:hypothetical protein [Flavisolibacter sp.]
MSKRSLLTCGFLISFLFSAMLSVAQEDLSTPGGYLTHFSKQLESVNQTYMNYLSAVSHGKSARKVEKLRNKTLDIILTAKGEIAGTPGFKRDKTYRDAMVDYLKTTYFVFNEDYHKIVNMEEVAEQSYDSMEAYLLAQKLAGEKLKEAGEKQHEALKAFAVKNNVTLTDAKDDLDTKLETAGKLNDYYNKVYLIFFRSHKQDAYLTDAINKNNITAIEQSRNALETYATAGLEDIAAVGPYGSDATMVAACKNALNFYKELATQKMEPVTNFILANDNFTKLKKSFDVLPAARRTQLDVDNFNKAVADINKGSNAYNKANTEINKQRTDVLNNWNKAVKDFFDAQMPYAK